MNNSITTSIPAGDSLLSVIYTEELDDNNYRFISVNKVNLESSTQIRDMRLKFELLNFYSGYWKRYTMTQIEEMMWSYERDDIEFSFIFTGDFSKKEKVLVDFEVRKARATLRRATNETVEDVENAIRVISGWIIDGHEIDVTDIVDLEDIALKVKNQED